MKSFPKERDAARDPPYVHTHARAALYSPAAGAVTSISVLVVGVVSDVNGKQMYYDRGSTLDCSADS